MAIFWYALILVSYIPISEESNEGTFWKYWGDLLMIEGPLSEISGYLNNGIITVGSRVINSVKSDGK